MKQKKTFKVDVSFYHVLDSWHKEGAIHFYDEEMILSDLRRRVSLHAELLLPKFWQASLVKRDDLDRYLSFTNNERDLPNDWEFEDDNSCETVFLTFEVEFFIPDNKKDAKSLLKFTF